MKQITILQKDVIVELALTVNRYLPLVFNR